MAQLLINIQYTLSHIYEVKWIIRNTEYMKINPIHVK